MDVLVADVQRVITSRGEQLTQEEANLLMKCEHRLRRSFWTGAATGSAVTWLALGRLVPPVSIHALSKDTNQRPPFTHFLRYMAHARIPSATLALFAGGCCGFFLAQKSYESSIDRMLSLNGSPLQRELANSFLFVLLDCVLRMLERGRDNPWVRKRVAKHFYPEEVYVDSSIDKPIYIWRHKNYWGDSVNHSRSTSYSKAANSKDNIVNDTPTIEPSQVKTSAANADVMKNPFDLILDAEDVTNPNAPTETSRIQTRREKRSQRRRRRRHEPDGAR